MHRFLAFALMALPGSLVAGEPVSFLYDVLPALAKHGCSAGACHGSPSGKGAFRLSLRGFDPALDRETLTREQFGRRIDRMHPERSLLLLKPTMRVPHGGGLALHRDDLAYRILRDWIADGCRTEPGPRVCERIAMTPAVGEFRGSDAQQHVRVTAHFSDGSTRDITSLAAFTSSDERVATVDSHGRVVGQSRGTVSIVAKFLDFVATSDFTFIRNVSGFAWQAPDIRNEIDRLVFARLEKLQIQPSPVCSDHEFIRRLFLDVTGMLPTRAELDAFAADRSPDKRSRLIDELLKRPEYALFWAQKRADLLRVRAGSMSVAGVRAFYGWLVKSVATNAPYDQFATELLTAKGSTAENPAANFYRAVNGTNDCAESASQLFLGIRIQCAKCHNHPFDRWSQDNYYGIGAFFSRVDRQTEKDTDKVTIVLKASGEVTQPRTKKQVKPWLPDVGDVEVADGTDRRQRLAGWLVQPDNPFFARVIVNRIWGHLFGRGIVEPVDDFNATNPPVHPDLLEHLAADFAASGFDQKHLLRAVLNSTVYQLSSRTNRFNENDDKYFSHYPARMLSAEQLLDAVSHVTGTSERFPGMPPGTAATALPSPDFGHAFLQTFGQPARNTVCECERSGEPNLARALELMNGELVAKKLRDRTGRIGRRFDNLPARLLAAGSPPDTGLVAWFTATDGTFRDGSSADVVSARDGDAVAEWRSRVAGGLVVRQTQADRRPLWVERGIGGLPAVRFDGQNDFLHDADVNLLKPGVPRTVVVVARVADDVGGALLTFGRQRVGGASVFTAQHVTVGNAYYVYSDGVNSSGNATVPRSGFARLQTPFVTSFKSPGEGKKLQVRLNGEDLPVSQAGAVGIDKGSSGLTIGNREDLPIGQQIWNGEIAEVLIYDRALSDADQHAVEAYLATRYDLEAPQRQAVAAPPRTLAGPAVTDLIHEFYSAAYCRRATDQELAGIVKYVGSSADQAEGLRDVMWAVLNSNEFLFQH